MTGNISLSWRELNRAAQVGVTRHVEALRQGCVELYGSDGSWDSHVFGAVGEAMFAKYMNLYWGGDVNTWKATDVSVWQVRTRSRQSYDLIIREADKDDDYFALVIWEGGGQVGRVVGWIAAKDARRHPEWLKDYDGRGPALFIPQSELLPLEPRRAVLL